MCYGDSVMANGGHGHIARGLFFTLPPAGFFLLMAFKAASPWSWVFLGLALVFFGLALRVFVDWLCKDNS